MIDLEQALRGGIVSSEEAAAAAAARFAERADGAHLVDVAYTEVDSPIGRLMLAATPRGLVRVGFENQRRDSWLEQLAERISPRVLEEPKRLDPARRQLEEYFEGRRREFDVDIDWSLARGGFYRKVLNATAKIEYGQVLSYREVAAKAGSPNAVRAAGTALGSNPVAIVVPCHRVLRTGGALGGYGGGLERKASLLELEGVLEG